MPSSRRPVSPERVKTYDDEGGEGSQQGDAEHENEHGGLGGRLVPPSLLIVTSVTLRLGVGPVAGQQQQRRRQQVLDEQSDGRGPQEDVAQVAREGRQDERRHDAQQGDGPAATGEVGRGAVGMDDERLVRVLGVVGDESGQRLGLRGGQEGQGGRGVDDGEEEDQQLQEARPERDGRPQRDEAVVGGGGVEEVRALVAAPVEGDERLACEAEQRGAGGADDNVEEEGRRW